MNDGYRPYKEQLVRADPRYSEVPKPCQHCKNLISIGNQFDEKGWTCKAFPQEIPNAILFLQNPHTEKMPSQVGEYTYEPEIYTESDMGKKWHYTAGGDWEYLKD